MATNAVLNVTIKAQTAEFESGMARVNAHVLTSRGSLSVFAAIAGQATGPLTHLVHAIELVPGPIGLAVAAIYLAREAFDKEAEAIKKNREELEKLHKEAAKGELERQKSSNEFEFGKQAAKMREELAARRKEEDALRHEDLSPSVFSRTGASLALTGLTGAGTQDPVYLAFKRRVQERKFEVDALEQQNNAFEKQMNEAINAHAKVAGASNDRLNTELKYASVADDNIAKMRAMISLEQREYQASFSNYEALKAAGKDQAEIDAARVSTLKEYIKLRHNMTEEMARENKLETPKMDQHLKDLQSFSKSLFENTRLPQEKLVEQIEKIKESFRDGLIDKDTFTRAIENARDVFLHEQEKSEAKGGNRTRQNSRAFGIGSAYVEGLKNREVNDPAEKMVKQQADTNAILRSIEKKTGLNVAIAG